ncbi:hypothetical protein Baya_13731 [Bagarius yarrelli]|uniref:Uncharacterized protein n=1 Tax=Bagarius yarrelli TaxID=175774 RepID=A0A556V6Y7_BAGYA|nr:hypothetical protein Baya_13731 [Bagarius yarrelli]
MTFRHVAGARSECGISGAAAACLSFMNFMDFVSMCGEQQPEPPGDALASRNAHTNICLFCFVLPHDQQADRRVDGATWDAPVGQNYTLYTAGADTWPGLAFVLNRPPFALAESRTRYITNM